MCLLFLKGIQHAIQGLRTIAERKSNYTSIQVRDLVTHVRKPSSICLSFSHSYIPLPLTLPLSISLSLNLSLSLSLFIRSRIFVYLHPSYFTPFLYFLFSRSHCPLIPFVIHSSHTSPFSF